MIRDKRSYLSSFDYAELESWKKTSAFYRTIWFYCAIRCAGSTI